MRLLNEAAAAAPGTAPPAACLHHSYRQLEQDLPPKQQQQSLSEWIEGGSKQCLCPPAATPVHRLAGGRQLSRRQKRQPQSSTGLRACPSSSMPAPATPPAPSSGCCSDASSARRLASLLLVMAPASRSGRCGMKRKHKGNEHEGKDVLSAALEQGHTSDRSSGSAATRTPTATTCGP